MSALGLIVFLGAVAIVLAAYHFSIKRVFELPLTGIELHPVYTPDGWRIMLYRHRQGNSNGEPVLLCHGFSSNHWNLSAPRGDSVADYLASQGYDCWAIDLRGTRSSVAPAGTPRHRGTFDGYVMQDLPAAIAHIRSVTGHGRVHWVGHSLGGTLLYAYELAHGPAQIASGTTIASPPELRSTFSKWQLHLIRVLEYVPGAFAVVQRGLAPIHALVKPRTRMVPVDWDNLNRNFGIAEFFSAVEPPPGPVTRTLEEWARHKYLAVDNDRVNVLAGLNKLRTPLLVFGCPLDPVVPVAPLRGFFERLPSDDKRYIELCCANGCERDYDHIDPPFAMNAESEMFVHIGQWIAAHPVRESAAETVTATASALTPLLPADPPALATVDAPDEKPVEALPHRLAETAEPTVRENAQPTAEHTAPWGRALRDAASILDGLGEDNPQSPRGAAATPKTKVTTKRRAAKTASAKPKPATKSSASGEKPKTGETGRKTTKSEQKSKSKTKALAESKKDKKKREKSKQKSDKKKHKDKKSKK